MEEFQRELSNPFAIVDSLAQKGVWMIHAGQRYQHALKFACPFSRPLGLCVVKVCH